MYGLKIERKKKKEKRKKDLKVQCLTPRATQETKPLPPSTLNNRGTVVKQVKCRGKLRMHFRVTLLPGMKVERCVAPAVLSVLLASKNPFLAFIGPSHPNHPPKI